jgi:tether containing UBX domain for GLUT4
VQTALTLAPISVVLRTVDPVEQLSGSFLPTTSVWGILRSLEEDARNAGRSNVNITERCAPSPGAGSGRLLYQMPAVRVANRELGKFDELRTTLQELGCSARELLMLRFLATEIPYEDALMEIAGFSTEAAVVTESVTPLSELKKAVETSSDEDTVMSEPSQTPEVEESAQSTNEATVPEPIGGTSEVSKPSTSEEPTLPVEPNTAEPKIAVYQPSSSATPAAAAFDVPDSAFEIGIAELKKIKENYHIAAQPQRLLSDKEIAEREAAFRQEMEKINVVGCPATNIH